MYELIKISDKCYYINCPAKIGIYQQTENEVYIIDSGNDKEAGRKVRKILDANGWKLKGILNTHSNADHIGGNQYLQQQTGCKVFTDGIEKAFTEYPILEPSFLFGGYPPKDLRHKFLLAKPSKATSFEDESFPKEIEVIPLKGHFFDMVGYRTPDNVVFLADCLSSKETLEKYQITFIYDVAEFLKTLDMVKEMQADVFVPSHADATTDIKELAELNQQKVYEIANKILEFLKTPMDGEELLKCIFDDFHLTMNFEQYVLIGRTIRSYLAWLKDNSKVDASFVDNKLIWSTIE
ncbi:MAG: MBL fold metallo-hydrolase [Eubacterium sp.]|nr:MBL fold metallo-hydrolase [Eubacterium sp.]